LGLVQGSMSICRYRLMGAGVRINLATLNERLDHYLAGPVSLEAPAGKEELIGWVRPLGVDTVDLPPDAPWDMSHAQVEDGFVLRMRIERRSVPAQLLQLIYRDRFFAVQAKTGKTPGPKERRELKDQVREELMGRALPAISYVDAFWRDKDGELQVFSTGKKARQLFETLFSKTFSDHLGQTLVRIAPPLLGLAESDWTESEAASETLERLSLTAPLAFTAPVQRS
jgi:DNA recombination-dependent growth factor C